MFCVAGALTKAKSSCRALGCGESGLQSEGSAQGHGTAGLRQEAFAATHSHWLLVHLASEALHAEHAVGFQRASELVLG